MHKHYHVGNNMVGYMPDETPYTVSSLRSAVRSSYGDARAMYLEERDEEYQFPKDERRKWYLRGSDGDYYVGNDSPTYLDRHFWIIGPCYDDDAEDEQ